MSKKAKEKTNGNKTACTVFEIIWTIGCFPLWAWVSGLTVQEICRSIDNYERWFISASTIILLVLIYFVWIKLMFKVKKLLNL